MPIVVFLCCLGLIICWIGAKRETATPKSEVFSQKGLTIFVPKPEQKYAT